MHEIKNAAIVLPKKAGTSNSRLFIHRSGNSILHSISSHFHPRYQIKYRPTPSFLRFSFSFQEDLSPKTRRYISKKSVHLLFSVQGVGFFIASSRRHPRCQIKCRPSPSFLPSTIIFKIFRETPPVSKLSECCCL